MALYTSFNPNNASTPKHMTTEAPPLFHGPLVQRAARAPVAALVRRLRRRLDAAQAARP